MDVLCGLRVIVKAVMGERTGDGEERCQTRDSKRDFGALVGFRRDVEGGPEGFFRSSHLERFAKSRAKPRKGVLCVLLHPHGK